MHRAVQFALVAGALLFLFQSAAAEGELTVERCSRLCVSCF
jgi:hypothetical protein